MSLLYRIIYAAHANGTHHKLALDALQKLRHPQAEAWRNAMLKHAALYLEGSKDPDNRFKDFKNHVLHVKDGYWGGAPEKVQNWYQHTVTALKAGNWSEAAYAAGVLSHYYTDPIHPFHTGQTEAENNIHRAVEWSINRAYNQLKSIADASFPAIDVPARDGDNWLREMTCDGADFSHRYYEKLIAHYDINRGVVDPPAGLDVVSRKLVAELIAYATSGFARILDRAFADSGRTPPDVGLTVETVLATLQVPLKAVQKRLTNAADRDLVQRMYDELKETGTVSVNLPEDDRAVRDLYLKEVVAARPDTTSAARAERLAPVTKFPRERRTAVAFEPPAPAQVTPVATTPPQATAPTAPKADPAASAPPVAAVMVEPAAPTPAPELVALPERVKFESIVPLSVGDPKPAAAPRTYLAASDDLEAAPSIGPKTAARFAAIGVHKVADFLDRDPGELSTLLQQRWMSPQILGDWQTQARLVMSTPGLRGTHAQLLVAAGYREASAVLAVDPRSLSPDIVRIRTLIADAAEHSAAA